MAVSFRFATLADIPALVTLRLAVDADQARRFGRDRWSTTINEKSAARGLKSSRVLVAVQQQRIVGTLRMESPVTKVTEVGRAVYRSVPLVYLECVIAS